MIPIGAKLIEVSNGTSTTILFRDARGLMRETMIRD
jgi:hypothetical protein